MVGPDTVIIRQTVHTELTAKDLGVQLSAEYGDNQAAIFLAFARDVRECYKGDGQSWPTQCRNIGEQLSDEECHEIAEVLEVLTEHLRGIPHERAEAKKTV